jgi:hypothetical protein
MRPDEHQALVQFARLDIPFEELLSRLEGALSERELVRWATMLLLNDAYVWGSENGGEEEIADALNDLSLRGIDLYTRSRDS